MEKRIFKTTWSRYLLNTLATAALITVLMVLVDTKQINKYNQGLLIQIGFNIILAVSLNLSAGFLGQLPLGHAGFMSVGAYTAALFTKGVNLPQSVAFPLGVLVGAFVAFLFGILIGLPALRLKGDYLAIITLGFSEIIRVIIQNLDFTGGAAGLRKIPKYTTVGWTIFWVVVTLFLICTLIKSRHGRAILSIREDEIAAEASGVSTTYYKVTTFALSAAFAGVAGALSVSVLVSALIAGGDTTFGAAMVNLLLTAFISGLLAVGIIRRRPYRQQVLLCGILTAIANIVIILTIGFMTNTSVADVFTNALWSAGSALLASVPSFEDLRDGKSPVRAPQQNIWGELPSPLDPPSGCRFHPRCPQATERCREEAPQWKELEPGWRVRCHLYG